MGARIGRRSRSRRGPTNELLDDGGRRTTTLFTRRPNDADLEDMQPTPPKAGDADDDVDLVGPLLDRSRKIANASWLGNSWGNRPPWGNPDADGVRDESTRVFIWRGRRDDDEPN